METATTQETVTVTKYVLTLTEAKRVYFDSLTVNVSGADSYYLLWSLRGPTGNLVTDVRFRQSDSAEALYALDLVAGEYLLTVRGSNNITGAYSFRMLDLGTATPISLDSPVSTSLTPPNGTVAYRIDASAGQKVYFDVTSRSGGDIYWRLLDPYGRTVWGPGNMNSTSSGYDVGPTTLSYDGAYTLLLEGRYNRTDATSFGFTVRSVDDTSTAIDLNETVASTIAKSQTQSFTFTLAQDSQVYFDNLTTNAQLETYYLRWYLTGPRGTVVSDKPWRDSDSYDGTSIYDLAAGDYTLSVVSTTEVAGNFSFRLLDLVQGVDILPGETVNATLNPANQSHVYKFDAEAGERFWFDYLSRSGGDIYWRLLDPYGRAVWGPTFLDYDYQIGTRTLDYSGTYTLLVEGRYYTSGSVNYSFRVQPEVDDAAMKGCLEAFVAQVPS